MTRKSPNFMKASLGFGLALCLLVFLQMGGLSLIAGVIHQCFISPIINSMQKETQRQADERSVKRGT